MAKSFLTLAAARRTAYEFSSKTVPGPAIKKILEAGRWAPSTLNSQPWQFIVVKNKKTIGGMVDAAYYGSFHGEPPVIIAIVLPREKYCGGTHRGIVQGRLGAKEALFSIAMPALSISLCATDLGVSSCIFSLDETLLPPGLGIRKGDSVPLAVGLGYEGGKAGDCKFLHSRKPLAKMVHNEKFSAKRAGSG
jgi:nitroreductase